MDVVNTPTPSIWGTGIKLSDYLTTDALNKMCVESSRHSEHLIPCRVTVKVVGSCASFEESPKKGFCYEEDELGCGSSNKPSSCRLDRSSNNISHSPYSSSIPLLNRQ